MNASNLAGFFSPLCLCLCFLLCGIPKAAQQDIEETLEIMLITKDGWEFKRLNVLFKLFGKTRMGLKIKMFNCLYKGVDLV